MKTQIICLCRMKAGRVLSNGAESSRFPVALSIIGRGFCVRFPLSAPHLPNFPFQARAQLFSNERLAAAKKIIWCPCYAHMRRKFFEAETGDPSFKEWMLDQFGRLFDLEQHAWQQSPEERLLIRQEQEVLIIDEMIEKVKNRSANKLEELLPDAWKQNS